MVFIENDMVECVRPGYNYNGNIVQTASGRGCLHWETLLTYHEQLVQNEIMLMEILLMIDGIHNFPDTSYKTLGNKCRHDLAYF